MAIPRGGGGMPSTDIIPEWIRSNLASRVESRVRTGLESLIEWARENNEPGAARALIEEVWDRSSDASGFLVGTRVSLHDFWDEMRTLDPSRDTPNVSDDGPFGMLASDRNDTSGDGGSRFTPQLVRDLQEDFPNLRSIREEDGQIIVQVEGSMSPADARAIGNRVGGNVSVQVVDPDGGGEDSSTPSGGLGGDGGSGGSGGAGGGGGQTWSTADDTLPEAGTARQIPGGEELWHVDGKVYLAYRNPNHPDLWMTWHVENPERLEAIYGGNTPAFDREMTRGQYEALSPWEGGLSAELQNTSEDPWTQFNSDFNKASERRPWLKDPTMIATIAGAYLEGRDPTRDELAETDFWNEHTGEERAFMENAVTSGRAQLRENIREEARKWLGPEFGNLSAERLDDWTRRIDADPSLGDDFLQLLRQQNRAMFKGYYDGDTEQELTYEDITTPFRNLASNVWGQPFDDEAMLVDLANTHDYTEAAKRLRETGRKRGVQKVWQDMFGALGQTEVGERVVRSSI